MAYDNEAIKILLENNYTGFQDTKVWVEYDYDLVIPEVLGGDGIITFIGKPYPTQIIGDRKFISMANTNYYNTKNGRIANNNHLVVSEEVWKLWVDTLGVTETYSNKELQEIRREFNMTPQEYRDSKREELEILKKPEYVEFSVDIKGQSLDFKIDLNDMVEFVGQLNMVNSGILPDMLIHDKNHLNVDPYTAEEASIVMGTMMYVMKATKLPIDAKITRLCNLAEGFTREDVDNAISSELTIEEQTYIANELGKGLAK